MPRGISASSYYADKLGTLADLFGAPVDLERALVRVGGAEYPVIDDVSGPARVPQQLIAASASPPPARVPIDPAPVPAPEISPRLRCPACGIGVLHLVETLLPGGRSP